MLGFAVAFICIEYSQNINHASFINPITALWLVAIPLLDCIVVLLSRILKGIMPFRPGRDHLHHRLLDIGFSPKKILLIFISLSIILASLGYYFEQNFPNKEYISFYAFVILSLSYFILAFSVNPTGSVDFIMIVDPFAVFVTVCSISSTDEVSK